MKKAMLALVILNLSPFTFHLSPLQAVEIDGVAANVNSDSILRSEVLGEMARAKMPETAFGQVLDELINRRLILKAAHDQKMTMQDWVVENRIREIIDRAFGGDRSRLMETLQRERVSYPEWHNRMRDDMIISAMRYQIIDKNISATPADLREEYERNRKGYRVNGRLDLSVLLLAPEDAAKAADIRAQIVADPAKFAELARTHSNDSHAAEGGVWKDVKPAEVFRPEVVKAIDALPAGELSDWIEIDGWQFLVRKDFAEEGHFKSFAEAYEDLVAAVKSRKGRAMYDQWIKRLREEAYIKIF